MVELETKVLKDGLKKNIYVNVLYDGPVCKKNFDEFKMFVIDVDVK